VRGYGGENETEVNQRIGKIGDREAVARRQRRGGKETGRRRRGDGEETARRRRRGIQSGGGVKTERSVRKETIL